jgi:hypothetical protein
MSAVDKNGEVMILHQETSASDVLVNNNTNTKGTDGASVVPSSVNTVQKLTDNLGGLAFKSSVDTTDLPDGIVIVDEIEEDVTPPESEINDNITSDSSTWSSNKINNQLNIISDRIEEVNTEANSIFYITLLENSSGGYTSQKTVAEIEAAYQAGKVIWIESNEVLLPLRKRNNANSWVFSGYIGKQAYDFTITATGVTKTAATLATTSDALPNPSALRLTGAVEAVYDGTEEVSVTIPEIDNVAYIDPTDNESVDESNTYENIVVEAHNSSTTAHADIRELLDNKANITTVKTWTASDIA